MKKKINYKNYKLLNSLISSDFLFLKNQHTFKNLNILDLIFLTKKLFIQVLNPLDNLNSIKQFIRFLFFFRKKKKFRFDFFVDDQHQKSIINNFFLKNKMILTYNIYSKFLVFKKNQKNSLNGVFFFKEFLGKYDNLSNFLLFKKNYLFQEINCHTTTNLLGSYKIFNKLSDYKKLIYILVFFNQILKKK